MLKIRKTFSQTPSVSDIMVLRGHYLYRRQTDSTAGGDRETPGDRVGGQESRRGGVRSLGELGAGGLGEGEHGVWERGRRGSGR